MKNMKIDNDLEIVIMKMYLADCIESIIDNRGKNPKTYFIDEKYPVIDNFLIKNTCIF